MPKLSSYTFTKAHQDHGHLDAGGGTGRRQESDAGAIDQSFGIGPLRRGSMIPISGCSAMMYGAIA